MSLGFNVKMDAEEQHNLLYVENLLGGLNEWRNINDIIRTTIKGLFEVVKNQSNTIKELEKQLNNKASKNELNSGLNIKANVADVMRTFSEVASSIETRPTIEEVNVLLEEKVSKSDLQYLLNSKPSLDEVRNMVENKVNHAEFHSEISSINLKFDEFHKDYLKKSGGYITNKELIQLTQTLENKANLNDVNEALNTKANKESVINALHRKANKNELDAILKNKVDLEEIQNLLNMLNNKADLNDFDKIRALMENKTDKADTLNLSSQISNKTEYKEFESLKNSMSEFKKDYNRKLEELDQDIDRLIENIKKEFGNMNVIINNLDMKKGDSKEIEKINLILNKKCDSDTFNDSINIIKKDCIDYIANIKSETKQNKQQIEELIEERLTMFERTIEKQNEELNRNKDKFTDIMEQRKHDQDEMIKLTKSVISNSQKDILSDLHVIKSEVQKCILDCQDLYSKKIDRKEFDLNKGKMLENFNQKLDVIDFESFFKQIQKELFEKSEETRLDINQILKLFENDMMKNLDKKANLSEVNNFLSMKSEVNHALMLMQNKANVTEVESLRITIENLNKDLMNKVDFDKFDNFINDTRIAVEDLQKDLLIKANIKEMLTLLKNKPDLIDVNNSITRITEELDLKCNIDKYNIAMDNQAIINDALCSENCIARWNWKSGQVKNGYAIPWEIQTVNTAPDVFFWEKEKTSIFITSEGLYEITMGIFAEKKPTVQLLINGEPVISAVNSSSYLIHHTANKFKNKAKGSNPNITGLTMIDYICLPDKARLSVSYSGDEYAEGFFGLKKL